MKNNIKVKEFSFLSSNGINRIYGKMWIPHEIKAVLQISHGMVEHIERYNDFACFMAQNGFLVVGNNHMGHGKSVSKKQDYGYFCKRLKDINEDGSSLTVKDLYYVTKIIKKRYPGVPYFMLGHSMGSFMARRYIMNYGKELNGVILMGTGNQPNIEVNVGLVLVRLLIMIKGERHRSKLMNKVMFGLYNKKIKNPITTNDWICSNRKTVEKYQADEECGFIFTLNGIQTLLLTIKYMEKKSNINKIPDELPIYFMSGSEDPVGAYAKGVRKVYKIYKKKGIADIDIKIYRGLRHEILNEGCNILVYNDVLSWLQTKM